MAGETRRANGSREKTRTEDSLDRRAKALLGGAANDDSTKAALPDRNASFVTIPGYEIVREVSRGGQGVVYQALQRSTNRTVAIKVIREGNFGDQQSIDRFQREVRVLAQLRHPNIVTIHDSGIAGGHFYYVMSYVEGGTLRDRLREGAAQSVADALDMIEQVAAPLGYMHDRGLVHRDVKPGNVFFTAERAVLGDFGLAKRLADRGITLAEEFIGTPLYLAPEVFQTAEFGSTVDFYALGVCAMEMLRGGRVVEEQDSMRLIGRILNQGLPSPKELLPDAPPSVLSLLEALTDRDPGRRPQDAEAVQEAVREARAGTRPGGP